MNVTISSSSSVQAVLKCQPSASLNSTLFNSSHLYYSPHHAAVLLFNHCWNITLTNVTVKNYYGFTILAANLFGMSVFESLFITNSAFLSSMTLNNKDLPTIGSGMLIYYFDSERQSTEEHHDVIVSHSAFSDNVNYLKTCQAYTYNVHLP